MPGGPRVLIACEFSARVKSAFLRNHCDAWSCDLRDCEETSNYQHIKRDVLDVIWDEPWDAMIAFPPCTYLASSGARWWRDRQQEQADALDFVEQLMRAPIPHIAIENPVGRISTAIRKPDQIIHPWQFGHGHTKATCLWLKNLPPLVPTNIVPGREPWAHRLSQSRDRSRLRSVTYKGIAAAMGSQWSRIIRRKI